MAYVLIENNIVVQKQPNEAEGFVNVDDGITAGMIHDGSHNYELENFSLPIPPVKTWEDVDALQNKMFSLTSPVASRIARYKSQQGLTGQSTKESASKFQEMLQYCQDIRDSDETTYSTPQEALDALNALVEPTE